MESQRIRKWDFRIEMDFDPESDDHAERVRELIAAIRLVTPSMLSHRVVMEIYQPVLGLVHSTVMQICQSGLKFLTLKTLIPGQHHLSNDEDCGHLVYLYKRGTVIDQQTPMANDELVGDQFMVHILCIEFKDADIRFNEFNTVKPTLSLVPDAKT